MENWIRKQLLLEFPIRTYQSSVALVFVLGVCWYSRVFSQHWRDIFQRRSSGTTGVDLLVGLAAVFLTGWLYTLLVKLNVLFAIFAHTAFVFSGVATLAWQHSTDPHRLLLAIIVQPGYELLAGFLFIGINYLGL
jgi:hypothetical protein